MMLRVLLAIGIIASTAGAPLTAHAYVSPEEVLDDGTYDARFYDPPPSKREVTQRAEEQRLRSEERRQAELNAAKPAAEEEKHEAAPVEEPAEQSEMDKLIEAIKLLQEEGNGSATDDESGEPDYSGLSTEELRDMRALERIRAAQSRGEGINIQGSVASTQETLHGGAPLSETGPATILTVLAIAGAIGETWRRVRRA